MLCRAGLSSANSHVKKQQALYRCCLMQRMYLAGQHDHVLHPLEPRLGSAAQRQPQPQPLLPAHPLQVTQQWLP